MQRRTVLAGAAMVCAGLPGCVMDLNNQSHITINATKVSCGEDSVDVNFDGRNSSQAVEKKLDEITASKTYTETPEYSSATQNIYETLQSGFNGTQRSGTIKYDGSCYRVKITRLYDD